MPNHNHEFLPFKSLLEFNNAENQTPLLVTAKYKNINCVKLLYNEGANLHALDNKMQNALHYSIHACSEDLIKFFVDKDPDFRLRKEKNIYDKKPVDHEHAPIFMKWLYTIWDAVEGNISNLVIMYVK